MPWIEKQTVNFVGKRFTLHGCKYFLIFFCRIVAESFAKFVDLFSRKAKTGRFPSFFATIELKNNIEAFQMMGLDHVPIIMHFGPDARAPKKFENNDPNDHSQLLRFFATQSGAEINVENSMKPEPRYSLPIVLVSVTIVLAGLILTGKLPVSMILQNSFIWSVATMVNNSKYYY